MCLCRRGPNQGVCPIGAADELRIFFVFIWESRFWDGKFHDQGDAKWIIVIRRSSWGHNDTPAGG
jgi:hypothetical protein